MGEAMPATPLRASTKRRSLSNFRSSQLSSDQNPAHVVENWDRTTRLYSYIGIDYNSQS